MGLTKCAFVGDKSTCGREFTSDNHSWCIRHRLCVSSEFVYDPVVCGVCSEALKFLHAVGERRVLSQPFVHLSTAWSAVQRGAARRGLTPSWADPAVRDFLFPPGEDPPLSPSCSSVPSVSGTDVPVPAPPRPRTAPPAPRPPLPPPRPSLAPPCPALVTGVAPVPGVPPPSLPDFTSFISDFMARLSSTLDRHVPPAPSGLPGAAPLGVPGPSRPSSPLPPPPVVPPVPSPPRPVPSSPSFSPAHPDEFVEDDFGEDDHEFLSLDWLLMPDDWRALEVDGTCSVYSLEDGRLDPVPGAVPRWGTSRHSSSPAWHFRALDRSVPGPGSLPRPSSDSVRRSLDSLALLARLPPVQLVPLSEEPGRSALHVPWPGSGLDPCLASLSRWWRDSTLSTTVPSIPPASSRGRFPVLLAGSEAETQWATFFSSPSGTTASSFPAPLSVPSASSLRRLAADRVLAGFGFSSYGLVASLERATAALLDLPDLDRRVTSAGLLSLFQPLLRFTLHQSLHSLTAHAHAFMSSHASVWRTAVSPLPASAQTSVLSGDPLTPSFGSPSAVSAALASAPQVAVVLQDPPRSRRGSSRPRSSARRGAASSSTSERRSVRRSAPYPRSSGSSALAGSRARPSVPQPLSDPPSTPAPPPASVPSPRRRPFRGPHPSRGSRR